MTPPFRSSRRHRRHVGRKRQRLRLEMLESRRLLATLTVTTTQDAVDTVPGDGVCVIEGGGCSLRAAIQEANELGAIGSPHQINVPAGLYTLTIEGTDESASRSGDLNIRTSLSLIGSGAETTIIDAAGLDRVIDVVLGSVLIQGVTLRGGVIDADEEAFEFIGGGLRNQADLTLVDSLVTGNTAGSGGGIANYNGILKIQRSVITGNGDTTTTRAGGVFNYAYYDNASLEIVESTIRDNQAASGGGVMNFAFDGSASTVIRDSTISANSATNGAGVVNRSTTIFADSSLANLSLRNSTVSGNTALGAGGGVLGQSNYGGETQTDVLNSTITGNLAAGLDGGGIRSEDSEDVTTLIRSTIVSGNTAGREGNDLFGQTISGTFNLIGDATGHSIVDGSDNNLVGIDARLGALADNGGPTQTHLLLEDSPAIDQGVNSLPLSSDQRGSAFRRTVDFPGVVNAADGTDIGAVEIGQTESNFDFGDAPDGQTVGNQLRRYPTTLSNDGARHRLDANGPFLGTVRPDAESDGQSTMAASGDDLLGVDDEDGFPSGPITLRPGESLSDITIAHDGGTSGALLNVWLDINIDGDWDDPGEQLVVERFVAAGPGNTSLSNLSLPSSASSGTSFLRARISTQSGLSSTGEASDGEVEDLAVTIGNVPIATADLSLRHTVDNRNPVIGETVTFTITVINDGPDRATNVEVTNLLPPELFFQQATITQGSYEFEETWFVGTLEPGASAELRIEALVETSDSVEHTAEITFSDQFDPDSTPANGISGEDDQATVRLGTCLSVGPLHVGSNRLTFSCASPGAWVGFVHGTERGTKTFEQYNVTVDLADAEGVAIAIADSQGIASALVNLTEQQVTDAVDDAGDPLIVQAFEMFPQPFKSNTLVINTEVAMLRASSIGRGGVPIEANMIDSLARAAEARWAALPLPSSLRQRLSHARIVISDLPDDALARVMGRTIVLDADAAGHGWYVDPTPQDDREYGGQHGYAGESASAASASRLFAVNDTASERIDLLTTLLHEYGHVMGLPDVSDPDHVMHFQLSVGERRLPAPRTNPGGASDVNGDGQITALDALQVINWLGRQSVAATTLPAFWVGDPTAGSMFLDTNRDFRVSAADALRVINEMARRGTPESESVALSPRQPTPPPSMDLTMVTERTDSTERSHAEREELGRRSSEPTPKLRTSRWASQDECVHRDPAATDWKPNATASTPRDKTELPSEARSERPSLESFDEALRQWGW